MTLPNGWAATTLGEIVWPGREKRIPRDLPHLPFIGMEHVEAHSMRLLGTVTSAEMKSNAVHFKPNDVLYGRLRPYLNKVFRPDLEGLCSAEFIVFPSKPDIGSRWLAYLLNSAPFVFFSAHLDEGDRPRVDYGQIATYPVLLPPRLEQDRIADEVDALVSDLEAAVAALKRVQANLKRYRASVLKAACEGRLVPTEAELHPSEPTSGSPGTPELARKEGRPYETGEQLLARILKERRAKWEAAELAKIKPAGEIVDSDSWKKKYKEPTSSETTELPRLPEGWTWATSDQLLVYVTSGSRGWAKYYSDEGPLFLRMTNLDHGTITLDLGDVQHVRPPSGAEGERTRVASGDILVSITADVGMIGVVPENLGLSFINQHVGLCRPVESGFSRYLAWYLASDYGQHRLRDLQRGATKVGLGLDDLRAVSVPIPPAREQERIVAAIEEAFSKSDAVEKEIIRSLRRTDNFRQAILKRAFEGNLVPQDPNDEPASVLLERIRSGRQVPATRPRAVLKHKVMSAQAAAMEN